MTILVVGGAGYIGSHMVCLLGQKGVDAVTLDNLSGGHSDAVLYGRFVHGDIADRPLLDKLFREYRFDVVIHFDSYIQMGESVQDQANYYQNNVVHTLNLLNAMREHGVDKFIFSSTAAIFGEPEYTHINEAHPKRPINPYGWSKLILEQALADFDRAYGLKSVCLRYFNAAGAHPAGLLGERHEPETHLIPLVLQAACGRRPDITVFGRDSDTPDRTCVRKYIHILDLAEAHWLAIEHLLTGGESRAYNLSISKAYSVQEVIDVASAITQKKIRVLCGARRAGDLAILVANSSVIVLECGWSSSRASLVSIVGDAWKHLLLSSKSCPGSL